MGEFDTAFLEFYAEYNSLVYQIFMFPPIYDPAIRARSSEIRNKAHKAADEQSNISAKSKLDSTRPVVSDGIVL